MSQGMSPTWQGLSGKTTYVLRIAKFYQAKLRMSYALQSFIRQNYVCPTHCKVLSGKTTYVLYISKLSGKTMYVLNIANAWFIRQNYTLKTEGLFLALGGLYTALFRCSHRDCTSCARSALVQVL